MHYLQGAIKKYNVAKPNEKNRLEVEVKSKPGMNITILGKVLILHNKQGQRVACGKIIEFSTTGAFVDANDANSSEGITALEIMAAVIGVLLCCGISVQICRYSFEIPVGRDWIEKWVGSYQVRL